MRKPNNTRDLCYKYAKLIGSGNKLDNKSTFGKDVHTGIHLTAHGKIVKPLSYCHHHIVIKEIAVSYLLVGFNFLDIDG